jgi:hypothetical protein
MNGLGSHSTEQKAKYVMVYKLFLTPSPAALRCEKGKIKRVWRSKIEQPGRQMTGRKKITLLPPSCGRRAIIY